MPRRLLLLFLYIVVAAALLFVPLPISTTVAGRTLENAGHLPLFLLGTLLVLTVLRHEFKYEGVGLYALAGLACVGAGCMSELIQRPLQRDASWEDVFADSVGVVCALASYALFDRRLGLRGVARATTALVTLVCIFTYLSPIVSMSRAYLHRNGEFPVLADFSSSADLFWTVGYGVNREVEGGALRVEFAGGSWPGISFYEPVPDWRGYRTLLIDVENPGAAVLHLAVRVHDVGHKHEYVDRFNRVYDLVPGERRILTIALEDVHRAPRSRLMNMGQISDVTLFRSKNDGSRLMRLYSMRLE